MVIFFNSQFTFGKFLNKTSLNIPSDYVMFAFLENSVYIQMVQKYFVFRIEVEIGSELR